MGTFSSTQKRKICIVTGSRADYGHLYWLMREIKRDPDLTLQIVATGMHLSSQYGLSYKTIEEDGFEIDRKVRILRYSDTEVGVVKSIGLGCQLFAEVFRELKPHMIVILGDRFEMLSAAIVAYVCKFPIVHIYGGESTQGAIDEGIRHSISKMSYLHFVANDIYRKRVIQLGEDPKRIFNVGALGLDSLYHTKFLERYQLEKALGLALDGKVAILTYHPVTLETGDPHSQIGNVLKAILHFDLKVVFTKTNVDAYGQMINRVIRRFCDRYPDRYKFFDNLGQSVYLSCLKHFDLMIGNSSSGLIEAPSFKLPVVNIGARQQGRIKSKNIINVGYGVSDITQGIERALSPSFRASLKNMINPYEGPGVGKTAFRIKNKLKAIKLEDGHLKKPFFDILNNLNS